jgi:head-tail adaptor
MAKRRSLAGKRRYVATILRPRATYDDRGQERGGDEVVMRDVPVSLDTLNGREVELARQLYPTATMRAQLVGDPKRPITYRDRLVVGIRSLEIGYIKDEQQNGINLELLLGEAVNE